MYGAAYNREADRQNLAALMQGHPVTILPGFERIAPLPRRSAQIDPDTQLKRRDWYVRPLHQGTSAESRQNLPAKEKSARKGRAPLTSQQLAHIRRLAETHTAKDAAIVMGLNTSTLRKVAAREGFCFQKPTEHWRNFANSLSMEKRANLAERLKACASLGVTREQAMRHLQIGRATLKSLSQEFNIEWAGRAPRK